MNENDPVDSHDEEEAGKGLLAGGAAALGGAAAMAKGAVDKAKDAAAAAKDGAAGAAGGVTDAASGAVGGVTDAAGGVTGAASGAAGGVVASGAAASAAVTGAAGDAVSGASGAVSSTGDRVVASGAAASASVSDAVSPQDDEVAVASAGAASAAVAGGAVRQAGGGGGGISGGSGGGGGGDDDDDKLIPAAPVSGDNQIIILGLLVALFMFFGAGIWAFLGFGDDAEVVLGDVEETAILAETNPECAAILDALAESDLDEASYDDVTCSSEDGEAVLSGVVENTAVQGAVVTAAAAALVDGDELIVDTEDVTVEEVEDEEVVEEEPEVETAAVETTTTTEAPETTTTTEAPETTTTTTEAVVEDPTTMWDALNSSGEAVQFAVIGGALGLQDDLELMENEDGSPVMRTLFAPSDAALTALGPEAIAGLSADPNAAAALVGYHFLEEALTAEDLVALDGQSVTTRASLPLNISVVDGQVVLNGTSVVTSADFVADNGIVHIIDVVLDPPTLNEVLELENIEFDPAQATITAAGQATLGRAVEFFTANPTVNASIEGHTDTDGSDGLNAELSQARADAVRQFLIDAGLDGERFTATGFGETQPILVDGVEDKAASRRIEFVVQ